MDTRFVFEIPEPEQRRIVWLCAKNSPTFEDFHRAINSRVCDIEHLLVTDKG